MKQKFIIVEGSDTTKLDNLLAAGWKITNISSSCTSCVVNGQSSFYSFCHVVLSSNCD